MPRFNPLLSDVTAFVSAKKKLKQTNHSFYSMGCFLLFFFLLKQAVKCQNNYFVLNACMQASIARAVETPAPSYRSELPSGEDRLARAP